MPITYTIAIDRDDDGDFADSGEDITAAVLSLHWRRGLAAPHNSVAEPGTATITVRNVDQTFSPEVNALEPGQVVRIQSNDGVTTRTHFTGHIQRVEPQPGNQSQRHAVIYAVDALEQMQQYPVRLPPQVNVTADTIIGLVLDQVPFRRTQLKGYWVLGRVDHSELGTNTRLPIANIGRDLASGQTTLAYVGDRWAEGIPAIAALRQVVEAERGRFYMNASGEAVFLDRHALLLATTSTATFTDNMVDLTYVYGAGVVSQVQVRFQPRHLGTAGSILWELEAPLRLRFGEEGQVIARFRDDLDEPMGALTIIPPILGDDLCFNSQPDGSGSDLTDQVDVFMRQVDFSAVLLEMRNRHRDDVYLEAGARLRGTPVYSGDPLFINQISYGSLTFYNSATLLLDLALLNAADQADSVARYELSRRKQPRGQVQTITLTNQQHSTELLTQTLFDRITIADAQTGHNADYFIIAEEHTVDLGGYRHQVTWTLESANANNFWQLGTHRLNQDTVLAY